ncbi:MAG: M24 family metallopeptidase [Candidatus Baldrarchaeia archaeon]
MNMIDKERIEKLVALMENLNLEAIIAFDKVNAHYLCGAALDYSASIMTKDGHVFVVCHVLEAERAEKESWGEVFAYSGYHIESYREYIQVGSIYEAACRVLLEGAGVCRKVGVPLDNISARRLQELKRFLSGVDLVDISDNLSDLRLVKTKFEVEIMKESCRITDKVMKAALNFIREGVRENEVAGVVLREALVNGASGDFITPIVASGRRSSLPHGRATEKMIERNDLVTVDIVIPYRGYYGDETRTIIAGSDKEKRRLIEVVLDAQSKALEVMGPGVKACDVDKAARDVINKAGYGKYFIHSTGHAIGLDIHEPLRLAQKVEKVLEPGMVLTVEPGFYIPGKYGARVEDDVLITKSGIKVLTKTPKSF